MTEQDRKLIIDLLRMLDGLRRKLKELLDKTT